MKLRYLAAALALLDWYLMMAPQPPGGSAGAAKPAQVDLKAPLSRWTTVAIFPTQKECEAHRSGNVRQRCLASSDPHFRDNNPPP